MQREEKTFFTVAVKFLSKEQEVTSASQEVPRRCRNLWQYIMMISVRESLSFIIVKRRRHFQKGPR